jgi:hypothetical protein
MKEELINRYIYAVTKNLPEQQRSDIDKELHGLIEDMLDERTAGQEVTRTDVEAVLVELGNPAELADKYRGYRRSLIGPALLPFYFTVVKIVVASIALSMLIVFMITTISDPTQVLKAFIDSLLSFIFTGLQGFAVVTLVFAVIDYFAQGDLLKQEPKQWKPADLPPVPDYRNHIGRFDPILSIIFIVIFTALFTFSVELFGVWTVGTGSAVTVVPFFDPAMFSRFILFIWIAAGINILFQIFKLILGRWSVGLVLLGIFSSLVQFALALFMFAERAIWNASFMRELSQTGLAPVSSDFYQMIDNIWERTTDGVVYLIGVVLVIEVITLVIKVVQIRRHSWNGQSPASTTAK